MRDAVGGTFMMYVFLIFLGVFICFIGMAFNFARAFRVKNKVIDYIEQNEGLRESDFNVLSGTNTSDNTVIGRINTYLNSINYNIPLTEADKNDKGTCFDLGYCIKEIRATSDVDGVRARYYQVTTFVKLGLSFTGNTTKLKSPLDDFLNMTFTIPIKGETRKVERIMP